MCSMSAHQFGTRLPYIIHIDIPLAYILVLHIISLSNIAPNNTSFSLLLAHLLVLFVMFYAYSTYFARKPSLCSYCCRPSHSSAVRSRLRETARCRVLCWATEAALLWQPTYIMNIHHAISNELIYCRMCPVTYLAALCRKSSPSLLVKTSFMAR